MSVVWESLFFLYLRDIVEKEKMWYKYKKYVEIHILRQGSTNFALKNWYVIQGEYKWEKIRKNQY